MIENNTIGFIETYNTKRLEAHAATFAAYQEEFLYTLENIKATLKPDSYHARCIERMQKYLRRDNNIFSKYFTLATAVQSTLELFTGMPETDPAYVQKKRFCVLLVLVTKLIDDNRLNKQVLETFKNI